MIYFKFYHLFFVFCFLALGCQRESNTQSEANRAVINQTDSLTISHGWARPAANSGNSAAYLNIFNGTTRSDTLISIAAGIAAKAEIHESYEEDGMAGMRPAGRLPIAADSTLHLAPGGFHIMLMKLNTDLVEGDSVSLQLTFTEAKIVEVKIPVMLSPSAQ